MWCFTCKMGTNIIVPTLWDYELIHVNFFLPNTWKVLGKWWQLLLPSQLPRTWKKGYFPFMWNYGPFMSVRVVTVFFRSVCLFRRSVWSRAGASNCRPRASPAAACPVNAEFLEPSLPVHLSVCRAVSARGDVSLQLHELQSLKYLLSDPLQKTMGNPLT